MKKFAVIALFLLFMIGCGPRLVYPHPDWLIPWYISKYISLDCEQKDMLQKRLRQQLDWHRRTQLPNYVESLRALEAGKPRTRYMVGADARMAVIGSFLPDRFTDWVISKVLAKKLPTSALGW